MTWWWYDMIMIRWWYNDEYDYDMMIKWLWWYDDDDDYDMMMIIIIS